jgi:hypothetical protein
MGDPLYLEGDRLGDPLYLEGDRLGEPLPSFISRSFSFMLDCFDIVFSYSSFNKVFRSTRKVHTSSNAEHISALAFVQICVIPKLVSLYAVIYVYNLGDLFIFKRILFVPAYEEMKVDDCSWTSAKSL